MYGLIRRGDTILLKGTDFFDMNVHFFEHEFVILFGGDRFVSFQPCV